jgi:hypothetical protein
MKLTTHQKFKILSTHTGFYCPEFGGVLSKCYNKIINDVPELDYYAILIDSNDLFNFCEAHEIIYRKFLQYAASYVVDELNKFKFNGFDDWTHNAHSFDYQVDYATRDIVLFYICRRLYV